ncbi:hypothetical protein J3E68DRAFT_398390 [Trichoderma sp. SZMC 28012]
METIPCVPDTEAFTYLYELSDKWEVVCRDMKEPDDKIMDRIESVDEIYSTWEVMHEDIMGHGSNTPDEMMLQHMKDFDEICTTWEAMHEDIMDVDDTWF